MTQTLGLSAGTPTRMLWLTAVVMGLLALLAIWAQTHLGANLLPHAFCISGSGPLLTLHLVSDAVITAAYLAIPLAMLNIVRKRRDIPFGWVVWFFGAFIVACGLTHAIEIWTLYDPVYWIAGVMKAFTAAVSVVTAVILFRLTPLALALPSGDDLRSANQALKTTQTRLSETVEELRHAERLLQNVLSTANDAIVVTDAQLVPVMVNEAALRLFRWPARGARDGLVQLLDRAGLAPQALLAAGAEGAPVHIELDAAGGEAAPVVVEATVSRFLERGQPMFTIVARDVTQRRLAEQELLRSNQRLQQFAFIASHDLRSPLRTIGGMLGIIRADLQGTLSALHEDLFRRIDRAVTHMNRLTGDLLAYARAESATVELKPVALQQMLAAARDLVSEALEQQAGSLEIGQAPAVLGDATQLTELFVNLFDNAIKYRSARPLAIRVDAEAAGGFCRITVSDNGIGIAPEHRSRIFEIFKRLHRDDQIPGTGIGLATASRIAQRHGGSITVDASASGGTAFTVTLPLA